MHFVDAIIELRVIDGDTVKVRLDRGWTDNKRVSLRFFGLNAPENKNTKHGGLAEKHAGELVGEVVSLWLSKRTDKQLYHTSDCKPKFSDRTIGRLIAGWPTHDPEEDDCLNTYLLDQKLVKPYLGKKREPWTPEELADVTKRCQTILGSGF